MSVSVKNQFGGGGSFEVPNGIIQTYKSSNSYGAKSFLELVHDSTKISASSTSTSVPITGVSYNRNIHAATLSTDPDNGLTAVAAVINNNIYTWVLKTEEFDSTSVSTSYPDGAMDKSACVSLGSCDDETGQNNAVVIPIKSGVNKPSTSMYYVVFKRSDFFYISTISVTLGATPSIKLDSTVQLKDSSGNNITTSLGWSACCTYGTELVLCYIDSSENKIKVYGFNSSGGSWYCSTLQTIIANAKPRFVCCSSLSIGSQRAIVAYSDANYIAYVSPILVKFVNGTTAPTVTTGGSYAIGTYSRSPGNMRIMCADNETRAIVFMEQVGSSGTNGTSSHNILACMIDISDGWNSLPTLRLLGSAVNILPETSSSNYRLQSICCSECYDGYVVLWTPNYVCLLYMYDNVLQVVSTQSTPTSDDYPFVMGTQIGVCNSYSNTSKRIFWLKLIGANKIVGARVIHGSYMQYSKHAINGINIKDNEKKAYTIVQESKRAW